MRDPLLIINPTPADEFYKQQPQDAPPLGWKKRTAPTIEDMNKAHENIRKLVAEKDRIIEQSNALVEVIRQERRWRKALTAALGATWAAIGVTLKILIPYALKGLLAH